MRLTNLNCNNQDIYTSTDNEWETSHDNDNYYQELVEVSDPTTQDHVQEIISGNAGIELSTPQDPVTLASQTSEPSPQDNSESP